MRRSSSPERRGRQQSQLLVEGTPEILQRGQRVRVAPAAVEREHELRPRALAQRLAGDERLELGGHHGVVAEGELGVDAILDAVEAQLRQARGLERGEGLTELGERLAPPEGERLAEQARRARASPPASAARPAGAAARIGRGRSPRGRRRARSRPAAHEHRRQRFRSWETWICTIFAAVPGVLAPEVVDEPLGRDRAVGVERQAGQQRPGLAAAKPNRCASSHLERPSRSVAIAGEAPPVRLSAEGSARRPAPDDCRTALEHRADLPDGLLLDAEL